MDSIPADLLEIKHRFDSWRATRKYKREPIPVDLREDTARVSRRYPYSLVRHTLKLDPRRLLVPSAKPTRRELAARRLDFYHKPVKTTRRKLTENFGQRPGKDTIAKQYSCPLKWDHLTRLKRRTAQN
jgi:hypothetical protein